MADSFQSPGYRVEAVQADKDGRLLFNKVWYLFLQQLSAVAANAGAGAGAADDVAPDVGTVLNSIQQLFSTFSQGIDQRAIPDVYSGIVDGLFAELAAQRDLIAELQKQVDGIAQGQML